MKKALSTGIAVLLLAGCSTQSSTEPPSAEEKASAPDFEAAEASPNEVACNAVEELSLHIAETMSSDQDAVFLETVRDSYDEIGLLAEGELQNRIFNLRDTIPDPIVMWLLGETDDYFEALRDVARACVVERDGSEFTVATWG